MESGTYGRGSESQDSDEPAPPGSVDSVLEKAVDSPSTSICNSSPNPCPIVRGIETAKKKLRAFAIQKKAAVPPVALAKPVCTGNTTVLIGKLSSVKTTPKPEKPADDEKKIPKPPKPGSSKKQNPIPESYTQLQKKTLSEIEDMKRKLELVELGIPLGLVCPSTNAIPVKAMPTKAMPPIKTFLDTAKIDEIIKEARKAKAEGKEFKFDYQKFVPDYDNPFQRKKDVPEFNPPDKKDLFDTREEEKQSKYERDRHIDKDRRKSDRYDRKHDYRTDSRGKYKERDRYRDKDRKEGGRSKEKEDKSKDRDPKSRDKDEKHKNDDKVSKKDDARDKKDPKTDKSLIKPQEKTEKDSNVILNEYVVCDSWSLDNEDKNSPQVRDKVRKGDEKTKMDIKNIDPLLDPLEQLRQSLGKSKSAEPKPKMEKLKPVIDSFKFEIDPNDDDDMLDIFDDDSTLEKYSKSNSSKDSRDNNSDSHDDMFLESIINEIKQEDMSSDDDERHEKSLVEYDESPLKDSKEPSVGSVTPELDDSVRLQSQRSDYSDGYKSSESRKSTDSFSSKESGYKSIESYKLDNIQGKFDEFKLDSEKSEGRHKSSFKSTFKPTEEGKDIGVKTAKHCDSSQSYKDHSSVERDIDVVLDDKMLKDTVDSLETWSFVLKICQPLLFRHDKNKCYKETRANPKVWYTQNPKLCHCVKDRSVVYQELEMCKMDLVDRLYGCDQLSDSASPVARCWYPNMEKCLAEQPGAALQLSRDWDIEEDHVDPPKRAIVTPEKVEEVLLDREYQRFMEAVSWSEDNRSTTPTKESRKATAEDRGHDTRKAESKKIKLSSEGWSQESEVEEEEKSKPVKKTKEKRKRKLSPAELSSASEVEETPKKRKKTVKKKDAKKTKTKVKRKQIEKKMLKKLKDKKKKKQVKDDEESEMESEKETRKKEKKIKKKKQQKGKKKAEKRRKRVKSSSSSSSSSSDDSSSESSSESDRKAKKKKKELVAKKKKKDKKKKRRQSTSESAHSEELFDMNIVANIKSEKLTDEDIDTAPQKYREIVNVTQLQEHFSSSSVQVKEETTEESSKKQQSASKTEGQRNAALEEASKIQDSETVLMNTFDLGDSEQFDADDDKSEKTEFKEPQNPTPPPRADDSSQTSLISITSIVSVTSQTSQTSQPSSQESVSSTPSKEAESERDDSHLRPSSANSNYSFNDVISKSMEQEGLENYDMYEQMAMAYQSDVASQQISPPNCLGEQRIETVVGSRSNLNGRGEIKCDWRASDGPLQATHRPSRWGLKPGEVNIVLTGGSELQEQSERIARVAPRSMPVYKIQSLANRTDTSMTYDEAYMDMYGASDRLAYGDCFSSGAGPGGGRGELHVPRSLDDRINQALRDSVLGEVVKGEIPERDAPEKGILVMRSLSESRRTKRVSFADGYKPGQDSDVEDPPVRKRKKPRRLGCPWPCPATHPDHVPLWDALPPPPPPAGSPPPPLRHAPPIHLLRHAHMPPVGMLPRPPMMGHKFDPTSTMANFMPPEPPPGLITFP